MNLIAVKNKEPIRLLILFDSYTAIVVTYIRCILYKGLVRQFNFLKLHFCSIL